MIDKNGAPVIPAGNLFLLEQLSSSLQVGIMVANRDGDVFYRNSSFEHWLRDYRVKERLWLEQMQEFVEIGHATGFDLKKADVTWLLQNKVGMDTELEISRQKEKHFFSISYSPLMDDSNNVCGIIEITENITDRKETEKSLQVARRFETIGRLASGIAHDFNNILQVINGHSEMLMELRKDDAKLLRSLDIILSSGQKAAALTRQLLLFSRRQQKEIKLLNLGEMLHSMEKILARMLGEDICMNLQCNDNQLFFEGDETQVTQVIMNLAINARDAMPEGGKININADLAEVDASTRASFPYIIPGKYIVMQFTDTGCGIPPDVLDHIFEPFFTTKEAGKGTGLGMATVYGIVKQHQGYINVLSKVGDGTTVEIYFPLSEFKRQDDFSHAREQAPLRGGMRKVLVIEDDDSLRELARHVLSQFGYVVQVAINLAQARLLSEREKYDLFLVDIVLPDGNGVSFIESLQGENRGAAYVLSSGYTEDKQQIKDTLSKGYTFLQKPFNIASLLSACSKALDK